MSEIERTPTLYDQLQKTQEIGVLHLKGYSNVEIAQLAEISPRQVPSYIREYKDLIQREADDDPYFLEKIQFNTLAALRELDEISKEAWETVTVATDNGMVTARLQALKLTLEIATKKAQLHQLLGGSKADGEYMQKMQKLESVNQMLSNVLRDTVADCDHCREKVRINLAEAYAMMQETIDAEVVE